MKETKLEEIPKSKSEKVEYIVYHIHETILKSENKIESRNWSEPKAYTYEGIIEYMKDLEHTTVFVKDKTDLMKLKFGGILTFIHNQEERMDISYLMITKKITITVDLTADLPIFEDGLEESKRFWWGEKEF